MTSVAGELRWLHRDVAVFIGSFWDTTCTVVRRGSEVLVIDSPVLPDELAELERVVEEAGLRVTRVFVTHAHWDHLLGGVAWPDVPMTGGRTTATALAADPDRPLADLAAFDAEHGVVHPPLRLVVSEACVVPGRLRLDDAEIELIAADGHSGDGTACWIPCAGVLVCGDYLSPVEIPHLADGGSLDAYLKTLSRLEAFVSQATAVIPGHGWTLDRAHATSLLGEDRRYIQGLRDGRAEIPLSRGDAAERRSLHEHNLIQVSRLSRQ